MRQYLDLLSHIIENGVAKDDRTGVGTLSTFGYQTRFDLSRGFPSFVRYTDVNTQNFQCSRRRAQAARKPEGKSFGQCWCGMSAHPCS